MRPPLPPAPRDLPITVVVPILNEKANLARCPSRLGRFAHVVVVDSKSTDGSAEIAREFDATVLNFEWNGHYPKKRNWVLLNHKISDPWVLFLDADELVTDRFCDAAAAAISSGRHSGYWLRYTNYFLGQRLRFGVPQRKLALFKVGAGLYEQIEEDGWSRLDMEVHEHPIVSGTLGEIAEAIEHNDFRGIEKFIDRHRDYARWEARRFLALEMTPAEIAGKRTWRQSLKYRYLDRWWYAYAYFIYTYIVRLGALDRAAGFQYALYKAWYFSTIRHIIRELRSQGWPAIQREPRG